MKRGIGPKAAAPGAARNDEFHEMLRHHVRDIRHLADYCRRTGTDPETVADWLEDAAAELVEAAGGCCIGALGDAPHDQNPVSIRA